jgi:uncharacterized protein
VDEFDAEDLSVTVALVGAPAAPHQPRHLMRSLELPQRELPQGQLLVAMHSNENGAETTVYGWIHRRSSSFGLPTR